MPAMQGSPATIGSAASAGGATHLSAVPRGAGPGLCLGFAAAIGMWGAAYLSRLPFAHDVDRAPPAWTLFALFLACYTGAGFLAGRKAPGGAKVGARAGAVAATVNLLVLLGQLWKEQASTAWVWIPGSVLVGAVCGAAGGFLGALTSREKPIARDWTGSLAKVLVFAVLLVIPVGGLVTSHEAGLAVPDWPRTFGSNMFLYPLSRMSGGIYFEHAHRLIGALVGLTTLVTAFAAWRHDERRAVKGLAALLVVLVCVQGALGGFRVTEKSVPLAVVHGMLAQVFFALAGALAALTSSAWTAPTAAAPHEAAETDRPLTAWTVGVVLVQLLLGALTRHLPDVEGLVTWHICGAVIVLVVGLFCGLRAWGLNPDRPPLRRAGLALVHALGLQLLLGVAALVARSSQTAWEHPITTLHQTTGAVILLIAVQVFAWQRRLVSLLPNQGDRLADATP